jgi:benzoylformate decarboxylase
MTHLAGNQALIELLRQEGIEILFGNPGSTELPLMDALAAAAGGPRYLLGLQEAAVLSMADGYAQASGRLAAVNLHAAPGLGNALGMLYNAKKAGAPLLVTAGQQDNAIALSEPLLWDDLPTIARPFVKWSSEVRELADLPRAIHRAAKVALTPPTGPVFLSLPANVLTDSADIDLQRPSRVAPGLCADRSAIEAAADLIASAKRPMIFAGDCIAARRAHAPAVRLAELIGAPVYAEGMASTASFPASHALFAGAIPRLSPQVRAVLEQHDLIVSLGGDLFTLSLPGGGDPIPPGMKIVHLDDDPWELGKNYPTQAALFGDPKESLPELVAALERRIDGAFSDAAVQRIAANKVAIAKKRNALIAQAHAEAALSPIRPLALIESIGSSLPADAVVIEEALSSATGIRHLLRSDDPQSYYGMRGGGIGWGLAAAIGVKLALPDRPVVALVGDGSALFTIQSLWTAAHENIGVCFVVLNNRSYRILKQRVSAMKQHSAATGRFVAMDLADPPIDFVSLARGFGVSAERETTIVGVKRAIDAALASRKPVLIDVAIDSAL